LTSIAIVLGLLLALPLALRAATASPGVSPTTVVSPAASAAPSQGAKTQKSEPTAVTDPASVISYLSDVISWYRHQTVESQLVAKPEEGLFYANDHRMANDVLKLAFESARAQADLNAKQSGKTAETATGAAGAVVSDVNRREAAANSEVQTAQTRLNNLQAQLAKAPTRLRATISSQVSGARTELELAQARVDGIEAMRQFAASTKGGPGLGGLSAQIDELEKSVPDSERNAKPAAPVVQASPTVEATGVFGMASAFFTQRAKSRVLADTIALSTRLEARIQSVRAPLVKLLVAVDQRGVELAQNPRDASLEEIQQRRQEYGDLLVLHKLAAAAALPLSKQSVVLSLYRDNLARWRESVDREALGELRALTIRIVALAAVFGLIAGGAFLWRLLAIRYVADPHRRNQILRARQVALWVTVGLVFLVSFASDLSAFATMMGFAAAGIALALQNVILSVAGYFFLIGRYGLKAGDRVQVGNTIGDVVSIGLVKLALMELGHEGQPTGRVVVYSNAIVFQPNGNFFKQAPGMSFIWNETSLTLAPDCDYRLAEKRLIDAVDEVFSRYRERVQRDYANLQVEVHVLLDTPRPQSRLQLTSSGLEMQIRYPAEVRNAPQIADEVSRRMLDAIRSEPGLKLVVPGVANIQQMPEPPPAIDGTARAGQETEHEENGAGEPIPVRSAKS